MYCFKGFLSLFYFLFFMKTYKTQSLSLMNFRCFRGKQSLWVEVNLPALATDNY